MKENINKNLQSVLLKKGKMSKAEYQNQQFMNAIQKQQLQSIQLKTNSYNKS